MSSVDVKFHLNRFQGLSNVLSSPVNFLTFSGQGKAISIFYPWYLIYPYKIIHMFTHNYVWAYKIYNILLIFIATQVSYYVTNSFVKSNIVALGISGVYMLSPISSIYLYSLAANGQLLAIIFTPIAIVGIAHLFFGDYKKWYIFVSAIALFTLGHVASILIYLIICVFAFIVSLLFKKVTKQRFLHIIGSGAFSMLFIIASLLPIFEQRAAYDLFMPPNLEIGKRAYPLWQYFQYTVDNHTVSNLGFITLVGLFTIMIMFRKLQAWQKSLSVLTIILVALMSNVFPWILVENTILGQIQDTHRFMLPFIYSTLLIFISFIYKNRGEKGTKINISILLLLLLSSSMIFIGYAYKIVSPAKLKLIQSEHLKVNNIVDYHSPDYENNNDLVKKALNESKYTQVYHLDRSYNYKVDNQIRNDIANRSASEVEINVKLSNTSKVDTPLSIYKGINVTINSKKINNPLLDKHTGTLYFNLNKGIYHIKIWYKYTLIYRLCQVLLLLSSTGFIVSIWYYKKLIRKGKNS